MKIYNAIWLDNRVEPSAESFYNFEDAIKSVKADLSNYKYKLDTENINEDHYFARIEDVVEVEIIGTEIN